MLLEVDVGGGEETCPQLLTCQRIPCRLPDDGNGYKATRRSLQGDVIGICADGSEEEIAGGCEISLGCPDRTVCAVPTPNDDEGFCERPIPTILSPFLLEMFNNTAATAFGLQVCPS